MKKAFTILFSLVYLFLITGITIEVHYCMGEVKSFSFYADNHWCCCESDAMPPGCCTDEQLVLQFNPGEQLTVTPVTAAKQPAKVVEEIRTPLRCSHCIGQEERSCDDLLTKPDTPIWLKHCSLTFYG
jgi:hypothetical protein